MNSNEVRVGNITLTYWTLKYFMDLCKTSFPINLNTLKLVGLPRAGLNIKVKKTFIL